jgi:hypothetical protein
MHGTGRDGEADDCKDANWTDRLSHSVQTSFGIDVVE